MSHTPNSLTAVLHALSDQSRRQILQRLALGPATSGQLAEIVAVSRPAASQHLRVLLQAGVVRSTVAGRNRWNELDTEALVAVETWVGNVLDTWTTAPTLEIDRSRAQKVKR